MTPWEVIAELESYSSRLAKEAIILREAEAHNTVFFEGVRLALDSMITFGLKQIPEKTDTDGPGMGWESFSLAITGFVTRGVTGNTARDMIASMMKSATKAQWNGWYRRILIKDLRCGVSEKTINNVVSKKFKNFSVPVFSCQLAHDGANHEAKVTGEKLIEVKLDGVRVLTIVYPDGRVNQYSRNGKELINFDGIREQFAKTTVTEPWVFDGEIMSSSFQDLMKQVHRKSNVKTDDAVLHLFDMVPLESFLEGRWKVSQTERSQRLQDWKSTWATVTPNIEILSHTMVNLNTLAGQKEFAEINKQAIAGGYEGIMIKDPASPYETKRTTSWLKQKPFIEVSLVVMDLEAGTGKNTGRLGALICQGEDDGKFYDVNVGSGFTDAQRDEFWQNPKTVIGSIVEIRADAATRAQNSETYSLRFPRFKAFRGFKKGEKI